MLRIYGKSRSASKTVRCTHCEAELEVAVGAVSTACPRCHKRVDLENVTIKSYYAVRQFATCGDVVVKKRGTIASNVRTGQLTVAGKVLGDVEAHGEVRISRTGHVAGTIHAPALVIAKGASYVGRCEIRPEGNGAPEPDGPETRMSQ